MKKLILVFIAVFSFAAITFVGCKKENGVNPGPACSKSNEGVSKEDKLCVCGGFGITQDPGTGEFSCPSGADCSKIMPCPCPSCLVGAPGGGDVFNSDVYLKFQTAYADTTQPNFFTNGNWSGVFPNLRNYPLLLSQLKTGAATFVNSKNSAGHNMYLAVSSSLTGTFKPSDVLFASELP